MNISDEELKREKQYLEKVKEILQKLIDEGKKHIDFKTSDIKELKRFMWENLSDYTDEERGIALYEMDQNVNSTNERISDIGRYEKAKNNPYFAKIVFKDDALGNEMPIYIGMRTVQDDMKFYVFDWRAPISSMFYNYELGPAKYEAPRGTISGELLSKMQFKIENGELIRCFNSDINIDDEYLQEVLSNSSSDKMKNIVSTIQREQNEIIRNDNDKYLIVQGVAGSGKTSVALHRIAYLLYKNIDLKSNNVLIFSPNDVFSDYISNVLPELGEENVLKSTINDFALSFLKPYKNVESYSEFLERVYSDKMSLEEFESIKYKMSDDLKKDIDIFVEKYQNELDFGNGLMLNGKFFPSSVIRKMFLEKYRKLPFKERINEMAEYLCNSAKLPISKNKSQVIRMLNNTTKIVYSQFELYDMFLKDKKLLYNKKKRIEYEDINGLLYLYFIINGFPNYNYIKQVVIDEAQDYSSFQFEILKKIFKNASFTILGDVYQSINPYYKYDSLEQLKNIFPNARYLKLTKTYRSSEEIIDYSNKILNLSNVCSIRKNMNIPVGIKKVSVEELSKTIEMDLSSMQKLGINKIAIITKDIVDAKRIYNLIAADDSNDNKIQLVSSSTNAITNPIVVIPSYLSKGLEFEGVIACNSEENNYNENEVNLYYVVCTRAQHALNVYNEPSKILKKKR